MSSSAGYSFVSALRSALSSAPTGPWPSALSMWRVPFVTTFTVASASASSWSSMRCSTWTRKLSTVKNGCRHPPRAAHQQLERGVGDLERVAARLALLQLGDDRRDRVVGEVDAELVGLHAQGRRAAQVARDHAAPVPDRLGRHVLVGLARAAPRRSRAARPCA